MKVVKVIAPVRIDFGGGSTDIAAFALKYGGCVLNAAINRYIEGKLISTDKNIKLEYGGNIPTSSGLGTSGVMNLVWLSLIMKQRDKMKLAEMAYDLEQAMDLIGGKQDQYAAAFGGINFLEFKGHVVKVNRLNLKKNVIRDLENSLVLVYTGEHYAHSSNKMIIENLAKRTNLKNLLRIKEIAIEMKQALLKNKLEEFAGLMNQETAERRKLHKHMVPQNINKLMEKGWDNGARGAKFCGAGAGGSVLFFGDKKKLKNKFKGRVIDFKFDFNGLRWF
tara:strand:- start:3578 stop:4411 length:834 start_codon:yes stop_codon:yes gene_type:complete